MVEQMKSNVREWKSTAVAIVAALVAVGSAAITLLDDDPSTVPDWPTTMAAVGAAFSLLFARFGK